MVHDLGHSRWLDIAEIPFSSGAGDGELIRFSVPFALTVQFLADGFEEQRKVLLVLGTVVGAGGAAGDGVFPVQIDAVQIIV